jgi:DNA polymerase-3 subunit gamma/tau
MNESKPALSSEVAPPPVEPVPGVPKENGRIKSTVNLQTIFKNSAKADDKTKDEIKVIGSPLPDRPVVTQELKVALEEFAESRKNQAAEYQLLKRDFTVQGNRVTIPLTNSIEEPLLQHIRVQLTTYLRDKLNNHLISVVGVLMEAGSKKVVYTNKEKFDHLAEKNPALKELKERLGLDTDF